MTSIGKWIERATDRLPSVVVGLVAFGAARLALLPDVGFWDTAELQAVAPLMGTAHPTGFPTYVLLGWLVNLILTPFGEPAFRMNLFAAISLAVAAAVTVDLVRALTRSAVLGVMAGLGLALTEIAWSVGTHADAHALHLALVAILLRLVVAWEDRVVGERRAAGRARRRPDRLLVAAAVAFGLALGNHSLTLLLAPAIALFVLAVDPGILRRPRLIAACAGALAVTVVLVFLELPLRAGPFRASMVYGQPDTWDGFWYIVLAEQFRESVAGPFTDLPAKVAEVVRRMAAAFGPLAALIPIGFVATAIRRPAYALLSGTAVLLTCAFAASYENAEIERYYLGPALLTWTWLAVLAGGAIGLLSGTFGLEPELDIGAGAVAASERADADAPTTADVDGVPSEAAASDHRSSVGPDPILALGLAAALLLPTAFALPTRLARVDRSGDVAAREWLDKSLAAMGPNAVVVSWWSYSTPLWYAQHIEGQRSDLTVIDDRTRLDQGLGDITDVIDAHLPNRPVYVIRVDPVEMATLERRYVLEPVDAGDPSLLARVVERREAGE